MLITSLDTIWNAIPHTQLIGNELHAPCPFCFDKGNGGDRYEKNGVIFIGDNRFFWLGKANLFHCRHCGNHTVEETAQKLFGGDAVLHPDFIAEAQQVAVEYKENPLFLHDDSYIEALHSNVNREYWYEFGWNDAVIDRFKLGFGPMYPDKAKSVSYHTIPFQPVRSDGFHADGWALDGRIRHHDKNRKMKTSGLTAQYFAEILEGNSDVAVICEGLKDGISAYVVGYRHIYAFAGNGTDIAGFMKYVNDKGYNTVISFTDNDTAGKRFLEQITKYNKASTQLFALTWPDNANEKYDLTDLLQSYKNNTPLYIEQNLVRIDAEPIKGFIPDVRALMSYEAPDPNIATPLEQVRSELPEVLREFITNYADKRRYYGKGVVKVLGAAPGSGKSYAMVEMAENLAKTALRAFEIEARALDKHIAELQELLQTLTNDEERLETSAAIEHFRNRRENLSCNTVLYAGPFINGWNDILEHSQNPELWYNYEARNKDNCEELSTISMLAAKGYVPMAYCELVCPAKMLCEQRGYLSQTKIRRSTPITYVRHQQLLTSMVNEYKYIFIDENCLNVFDDPLIITVDELQPTHTVWDAYTDLNQAKIVTELVEAVRVTMMQADPALTYSGRALLDMIDVQLLDGLAETLENIDPKTIAEYQPKTVQGSNIDVSTLPIRCLPTLYQALMSELELYKGEALNYNSGLHLVNGKLEIYSLSKLNIPSNHPIIISDGTPMPELYGYLLDRQVETYAPKLYHPQTQTTVLYGSDFTRTSIKQQIGYGLQDFNRWLEDNHHVVEDVFGQSYDLTQIPFDDNLYDSAFLTKIITLLKYCAEQHKDVLFVTYKNIRVLIEKRMQELYPQLNKKIYYGHYYSLRGTNRYKDVEAVFLVGCPRIPYDILHRKIQAWAKVAGLPHIPFKLEHRITPYSGVFRYEGHSYITFADSFADSFVNMVESGEIRQNYDRIRPYSSVIPKHIYLALSRPSAQWVTKIDRVGRFANNVATDKFRNAYQHLKDFYQRFGKFPTYESVINTYNVSHGKVRQLRKIITEEIQ